MSLTSSKFVFASNPHTLLFSYIQQLYYLGRNIYLTTQSYWYCVVSGPLQHGSCALQCIAVRYMRYGTFSALTFFLQVPALF